MDDVSKELKEYGTIEMLLPEAGTLERASTYRDKKIKPLFIRIKIGRKPPYGTNAKRKHS